MGPISRVGTVNSHCTHDENISKNDDAVWLYPIIFIYLFANDTLCKSDINDINTMSINCSVSNLVTNRLLRVRVTVSKILCHYS